MTVPLTNTDVAAFQRQHFGVFTHKSFNTLNQGRAFEHNWHLDAIAHHLEACRTGSLTRLIVNVPPRSLKSQMVSVAFPAYALGRDPTKQIICLSYSQELALKHARDFRSVVGAPWYQSVFLQTTAARDTETEFGTSQGGFRLATSIGGTLTGRGADIIIIDDPLKPEEAMSSAARDRVNDFFGSTLYSRLNDKQRGVIILVMQRLHHEDLVGHLLKDPGWEHLNLPAIATKDESISIGNGKVHQRRVGEVLHPGREPLLILNDIKRKLGSAAFQAQYQQAPVPDTGNMIKREWLRYYEVVPDRQEGDLIGQSLDTAMKDKDHNDYSVCTTWLVRKEVYYLLDVVRRHCDYPTLLQLIVSQYRARRPNVLLIEDQAFGAALIPDLRRHHDIHAIGVVAKSDKINRMSTASQHFEAGQVHLPREAPWLGEFLEELLSFPQTRFDDQVDSVSQFLNWHRQRTAFSVSWGDERDEKYKDRCG